MSDCRHADMECTCAVALTAEVAAQLVLPLYAERYDAVGGSVTTGGEAIYAVVTMSPVASTLPRSPIKRPYPGP